MANSCRYSLFVILYPVGIGSGWWLVYKAAIVTGSMTVTAIFYFCLGLYAPGESTQSIHDNDLVKRKQCSKNSGKGAVMMYMYMLTQRRKILAK